MRKILFAVAFALLVSCQGESARIPAQPAAPPPRHEFKFISYDPPTQTLLIQFNDGSRSNFAGVAETVYSSFMRAGAKMDFFTNNIQGRYSAKTPQ